MSEFGDKFADNLPGLFEKLESSQTIRLSDGSTLVRSGIFNVQQYAIDHAIDHTNDGTFIYRDNATTGLTKVQADRATVVIDNGTEWDVVDAKQDMDGAHQLTVKAPQLIN